MRKICLEDISLFQCKLKNLDTREVDSNSASSHFEFNSHFEHTCGRSYADIKQDLLECTTRSSPHRSTTAHTVLNLRSLIWSFGKSSCTIVHGITSQPAYVFSLSLSQICSLDIYVDLQPFSCNLIWGFFDYLV